MAGGLNHPKTFLEISSLTYLLNSYCEHITQKEDKSKFLIKINYEILCIPVITIETPMINMETSTSAQEVSVVTSN